MNTRTHNRRGRSGSRRGQKRTLSHSQSRNKKRGASGPKRYGINKSQRSTQGGRGKRGGGRKMPTFNPVQFINTNPATVVTEEYRPQHQFSTFGLNPKLVETITSMGIKTPTPIQDQIIPEILNGRDVIGLAETGTGKTAAFLLPIIEKTIKEDHRQTLILAPTRELAIQIEEELTKFSRGFRIFSVTCVGGISIRPQIRSLRKRNHFIIGTPGRIMDLIERKEFLPEKITTVVLDEADRMLDMGFINDMRSILSKIPKSRETLFFSATMSSAIQKIVADFLNNPITISVKKKDITDSIEQDIVKYREENKFETLTNLLDTPEFKRVLIFGAMKYSVEKLAKQLSNNNVSAESIHGNKNHKQRQSALTKFKSGDARVLVATDVAARGIHVDDVTHVINYDLPETFEDYVHRIGRTGRADKRGKALTFVQTKDARY